MKINRSNKDHNSSPAHQSKNSKKYPTFQQLTTQNSPSMHPYSEKANHSLKHRQVLQGENLLPFQPSRFFYTPASIAKGQKRK